jgi:hypothetical protein
MVEKVHALTTNSMTWQDTTERITERETHKPVDALSDRSGEY